MDPSDLLGEAGVLAAVFATISAALAGIASYYARAPSAANAKRGRPPRVDRKTLLSLLENSARNAHTAQVSLVICGCTLCDMPIQKRWR